MKENKEILPETQQALKNILIAKFPSQLELRPSHAWKGYGLTFGVLPENLKEVMSFLRNEPSCSFEMLIDVTCVDWLDSEDMRFEVVYQLMSMTHTSRICIKVRVPENNPSVASVRDIWASANFLEREVYDMYGIIFEGHGDLRRILMYDEFVGFPLRKDYPLRGKQPRVPLRVPELRNTSADLSREQLVSLPVRRAKI